MVKFREQLTLKIQVFGSKLVIIPFELQNVYQGTGHRKQQPNFTGCNVPTVVKFELFQNRTKVMGVQKCSREYWHLREVMLIHLVYSMNKNSTYACRLVL